MKRKKNKNKQGKEIKTKITYKEGTYCIGHNLTFSYHCFNISNLKDKITKVRLNLMNNKKKTFCASCIYQSEQHLLIF